MVLSLEAESRCRENICCASSHVEKCRGKVILGSRQKSVEVECGQKCFRVKEFTVKDKVGEIVIVIIAKHMAGRRGR